VTLFVSLDDDGGTADGGVDRTTKELDLRIVQVNTPPSFVFGSTFLAALVASPNTSNTVPTVTATSRR